MQAFCMHDVFAPKHRTARSIPSVSTVCLTIRFYRTGPQLVLHVSVYARYPADRPPHMHRGCFEHGSTFGHGDMHVVLGSNVLAGRRRDVETTYFLVDDFVDGAHIFPRDACAFCI